MKSLQNTESTMAFSELLVKYRPQTQPLTMAHNFMLQPLQKFHTSECYYSYCVLLMPLQ